MDTRADDKFTAGQPSTPFVPQSGGTTTQETLGAGPEAPEPRTNFDNRKTPTASLIEDLATAAGEKAKEYQGKAEQAWDDAQDRARSLHKESERYVRQNPIKAIVSAAGIGLLLGLIFRRR